MDSLVSLSDDDVEQIACVAGMWQNVADIIRMLNSPDLDEFFSCFPAETKL